MPIGASEQLAPVFEQLLSQRLSAMYDPLVMWWTEGSAIVEPSCLIAKGLPHPDTFGALLDGSWAQHRWRSVAAQVEPDSLSDDARSTMRRRCAFGRPPPPTSAGCARSTRTHSSSGRRSGSGRSPTGSAGIATAKSRAGWSATRLPISNPHPSFEATIEAARERMHEVNEHLLRTVDALADRRIAAPAPSWCCWCAGSAWPILWAGDSRVYRWRAGRLEQLTRDHSAGRSGGHGGREESHGVTRAVGVEPTLDARPVSRSGARRRSIPPVLGWPDASRRRTPRSASGWNKQDLRGGGRRADQGHAGRGSARQRHGGDRRGLLDDRRPAGRAP